MKHHQISLVELRANSKQERDNLTEFYQKTFGWEYKDWGDQYSDTKSSGLESAVDVEPSRKNITLVVVYSQDLSASQESILAAGGKMLVDTYEFPGGKRFHFLDPAGNEIAVWSDKP